MKTFLFVLTLCIISTTVGVGLFEFFGFMLTRCYS